MLHVSELQKVVPSTVITKRDLFHHVARIFDPYGVLIPVTFHGKVFIQKLWTIKQSWDDLLPKGFMVNWDQVISLLMQICRFLVLLGP